MENVKIRFSFDSRETTFPCLVNDLDHKNDLPEQFVPIYKSKPFKHLYKGKLYDAIKCSIVYSQNPGPPLFGTINQIRLGAHKYDLEKILLLFDNHLVHYCLSCHKESTWYKADDETLVVHVALGSHAMYLEQFVPRYFFVGSDVCDGNGYFLDGKFINSSKADIVELKKKMKSANFDEPWHPDDDHSKLKRFFC